MSSGGILISDFDGTLTRQDFFRLVLERLAPPGAAGYWEDYRAGRMTHFETLRTIFALIRAGEADVLRLVRDMDLDPGLAEWLRRLRRCGWEVVVASAGCDWYIRRLLAEAGVSVEVHANPGQFVPGQGLLMSLPDPASPYFSPTVGVDKSAIVRAALAGGQRTAFAGDGYPDLEAARLVPAELRFARADLAEALRGERLPFRPFERWSDVARLLVEGDEGL